MSAKQILARCIKRELRNYGVCTVYDEDLSLFLSLGGSNNHQAQVAQFARDHGFHLSDYKERDEAVFSEKRRDKASHAGRAG